MDNALSGFLNSVLGWMPPLELKGPACLGCSNGGLNLYGGITIWNAPDPWGTGEIAVFCNELKTTVFDRALFVLIRSTGRWLYKPLLIYTGIDGFWW